MYFPVLVHTFLQIFSVQRIQGSFSPSWRTLNLRLHSIRYFWLWFYILVLL